MPMPEMKPASAPCSMVRRKHSTHIGPTVAASRKPKASPLRNRTVMRRTRRRSGFRTRGELGGGEVPDASEAGDEARVARHDAPEGKVRELKIDRLFRETAINF